MEMKGRKITTLITCLVLTALYVLHIYYTNGNTGRNDDHRSTLPLYHSQEHFPEIWHQRIEHVRQVCSNNQLKENYNFLSKPDFTDFFHSPKLNISVCKVPKSGATFWAFAYLILDKGIPAGDVFSIHHIHERKEEFLTRLFLTNEPLTTDGVLIARDPYSRLYSAFIDKFFLLRNVKQHSQLGQNLKKGYYMTKYGHCGYDITFKDFLEFVLSKGLKSKIIDGHWCPVYILCKACDINYKYVLQQETFTRDIEQMFLEHQVEKITNVKVSQLLGESTSQKILNGVIHTMWDGYNSNMFLKESCSNAVAYFAKIWKGLQIQGYVNENIPFSVSNDTHNSSMLFNSFLQNIFNVMNVYPLSSKQRKVQRRKALVEAYKEIPKQITDKIQEVYLMDFLLFKYDTNPPK